MSSRRDKLKGRCVHDLDPNECTHCVRNQKFAEQVKQRWAEISVDIDAPEDCREICKLIQALLVDDKVDEPYVCVHCGNPVRVRKVGEI